MFVIKIPAERLKKARTSENLVPEKRIIRRDGKNIQMTVWVNPIDLIPAIGIRRSIFTR